MRRPIVTAEHRKFAKELRRSQTALEARLWHELRAHCLDGWKFRRQVPIGKYVADFVCHAAQLIVEVDGPLHRSPEQKLKDIERDRAIGVHGFRIMRFDEDMALGSVVDNIRRALAEVPLPTPD
jgi:very-short-patch-repair endonuclease